MRALWRLGRARPLAALFDGGGGGLPRLALLRGLRLPATGAEADGGAGKPASRGRRRAGDKTSPREDDFGVELLDADAAFRIAGSPGASAPSAAAAAEEAAAAFPWGRRLGPLA